MKALSTKQWIDIALETHGTLYDYSRVDYKGALGKVEIVCKLHGPFWQVAATHLQGKGCPTCARNKNSQNQAYTTETFKSKAREVHGERYDYSRVFYTRARNKVEIICPIHGPFWQEARRHLKGSGCPACGREKPKRKPRNDLSLQQRVNKCFGEGKYNLPDGARATKDILEIVCREHGPFRRRVSDLLTGCGCPICSQETQLEQNKQAFICKAREVHGDIYDYTKIVYVNSIKPVENIVCRECGPFKQTRSNHLTGNGCPVCGDKTRRYSKTTPRKEWMKKFRGNHANLYHYKNLPLKFTSTSKINITCPKHGDFTQQAIVHAQGHGCPSCVHMVSSYEHEIVAWLRSVLPKGTHIQQSRRDLISPQELDIYVPSRKVAIEFNGTYWHCHERLKDRLYHQKKALKCAELGLQLLHVYEWQWEAYADKYKSLILAKLGVYGTTVRGRKTSVKPVTSREAKQFLDLYHLQGSCNGASVNIGLFHNNTLSGVMTFGKPRFSTKATWELIRLCYKPGVSVTGGSCKLFKHFDRAHLKPGDTVVSFANLDYSSGGVYETLGFQERTVCAPNYVWILGEKILSRYQTQKHLLRTLLGTKFNAKLSETDNMQITGWKKVFTAGNLRYTFHKND